MTTLVYPEKADCFAIRLGLFLTNFLFKINDNWGWVLYRVTLKKINKRIKIVFNN